ncbi:MAG: AAA family ATPase [Rhodothermaceae bacterium]
MIGQAKRLAELNKLYGMQPEVKMHCPVISIISGKGGTGKSFFALNSALNLAEKDKKVLLIDLDKNLSNLHIMLNEMPEETVYHVLMNKTLVSDAIVKLKPNIDCLFGDSGKSDHPELNSRNLDSLFKQLSNVSNRYDFIIIDTASGVGEELKYLIKKSETIVVVTNPEPTSIMDSYVVLKEMRNLNFDKQKFVVINKSPDEKTGFEAFQNLRKAVKHFLDGNISILGVISNNLEISKSIIKQIPIMLEKGNIVLKSEIEKIVNNLIKNHQVVNNNH